MNPNQAAEPALRHQRGVSLIEVLVSVLVVSLGLLGAVALQATALRNNQGSYERTQTAILTQGIFDAMRANMPEVNAGAYDTGGLICAAPAAGNLASLDLARWINSMHAQIHPGACGSVDCEGSVCTVQVQWDDSRASGGLAAQNISLTAQL